uniref:Uncharacterized protein n=1 Tax=Zea mays TaxID=4577 RepID=A0A804RAY9_MAIZE
MAHHSVLSTELKLSGSGGLLTGRVTTAVADVLVVRVLAEELHGVLQAPAHGLRQEEVHEHPACGGDARVEVEAAGDGDGVGEREEGHGGGAAHDPVEPRADGSSLRAQPQRVDLGAVDPGDGAQAGRERRHERQHGRDAHRAQCRGLPLGAPVHHVQGRGQREEEDGHPAAAGQQQRAAADAVQEQRGDGYEEGLARAHRHGRAQRVGLGLDARPLEHPRAVHHHAVHARGLLDEHEAEPRHEHAAHGAGRVDEQLLPHPVVARRRRRRRCLAAGADDGGHVVGVGHALGDADHLLDVEQTLLGLGGGVGGLLQHAARVVDAAPHDEPARRLRHGEDGDAEEDGRHGADQEHGAPAEVDGQAREGEVGDVAEEDAEVVEDLREGGEEAARGGGRHLGGVHGGDHEREADADAGHEAARHEEPVVRGEAHEERAREEDGGRQHHGVAAAEPVGGEARGEGAEERVDVDDAGEDLDLRVRDLEVLLHEQLRAAHHRDVWSTDRIWRWPATAINQRREWLAQYRRRRVS